MSFKSRQPVPFKTVICLAGGIFLLTLLLGLGQAESLRFVVLGDNRGDPNLTAIAELNAQILALSPRPAFVVFGGDLALFGGTAQFQAFKTAMQQDLDPAGISLYMVMGNHELKKQGSGDPYNVPPLYDEWFWNWLDNQTQFQSVFADLPNNGPAGYDHLVYSFESPQHTAFFAVLDPYYLTQNAAAGDNVGMIDQAQLDWLETQLNTTPARHKFVFVHVPAYLLNNPDGGTYPVTYPSYMELWRKLEAHQVSIYFAAHNHCYSRKTITAQENPESRVPIVQVISGDAGANKIDPTTILRDPGEWRVNLGLWYYTVVDIMGDSIYVNTYGGKNGPYGVIDRFTLPPAAPPALYNLLMAE